LHCDPPASLAHAAHALMRSMRLRSMRMHFIALLHSVIPASHQKRRKYATRDLCTCTLRRLKFHYMLGAANYFTPLSNEYDNTVGLLPLKGTNYQHTSPIPQQRAASPKPKPVHPPTNTPVPPALPPQTHLFHQLCPPTNTPVPPATQTHKHTCSTSSALFSAAATCALAFFSTARAWSSFCVFTAAAARAVSASACRVAMRACSHGANE